MHFDISNTEKKNDKPKKKYYKLNWLKKEVWGTQKVRMNSYIKLTNNSKILNVRLKVV